MKYKVVLFDLDGTLLDTSSGIIHCYNETCRHFGKSVDSNRDFHGIIGGALLKNFEVYFGFDSSQCRAAVDYYRQEYASRGIHLAENYPGVKELLAELKKQGAIICTATLKREDFAVSMLTEYGLADYFDYIIGMDADDTRTKASIIRMCQDKTGALPQECILVGDSRGDSDGAEKAGVDFAGVTYGWGFSSKKEIESGYYTFAADSVDELKKFLI